MPSIGGGSVDIRTIVGTVVNFFKSRANQICAATCDGLVLRMHYRWTFCLLLGGFLTVWYSWFHRDVITCVSHFNSDTQVRLDYINVCLSYPYIDEEGGERRYILYYRWISWALLTLAWIYYIPRKVSKGFDNARCKKLLEDLAANSSRYDQAEEQLVERTFRYVVYNLKTHDGLYWKFLSVNFIALAVDLFAMFFLNFVLNNRFIGYGILAFPYTRDPRGFTDYMSQTFPPFATCELGPVNQLVNKRHETLGCHLTIMELYEKLFLGLWLWLIILITVTICYIIFLLCMWLPCMRAYLLRVAKPAHAKDNVRGMVECVSQNCKIGDIYLLYRLKGHLSHARFYELLQRLGRCSLFDKSVENNSTAVTHPDKVVPHYTPEDTLRNRRPNIPQGPQVNHGYPQQNQGPQVNHGYLQQNQGPQVNHGYPQQNQGPQVNHGYLQQNLANQGMMNGVMNKNPEKGSNLPHKNTSILIG
ncbi:hypothetical protein Pcinc_037096 [Petrolisthes cinctipes]|uniref:Innexin n=1 Tax=Petrolisthes cinctipes TaxID=88211 RepID=A0AAE1BTG7_PETCI|nr:hypothetical protein Pcinc_037096 [Petrolisthes cinctipes]